jgi:multiple sugar transport system substrate-binding protein
MELRCWFAVTEGEGESFNAVVAEFNRTHRDIRIVTEAKSIGDYYPALVGAIAAGNAPDVAMIQQGSLPHYVNSGSLYALDGILAQLNPPMDDFMEVPLEACRINGRLYALPLDIHPLVMFYNTGLLNDAGIEQVPETYADLIQVVRTIQSKTGAIGIAADNTASGHEAWTLGRLFISFLKQQGTDVLTEDNTKANFNNPAGEKALSALIDLNQVFKIIPPNFDYDASVAAFRQGEAGIHINGLWATGVFEKQRNLKFSVAPLPPLFGQSAAWADSYTLAIPARQNPVAAAPPDPDKVEAAMTFALWMTERGELWAKAGHIPVRKSVIQKPEFQALPFRTAYLEAAGSAIAPPRTPAWDEICNSISTSLEQAVTSSKGIKTILIEMDRKVNEVIASYL